MLYHWQRLSVGQVPAMSKYHHEDFEASDFYPFLCGKGVELAGLTEMTTERDVIRLAKGLDPSDCAQLTSRFRKSAALRSMLAAPKPVSGLTPFDQRVRAIGPTWAANFTRELEHLAIYRDQRRAAACLRIPLEALLMINFPHLTSNEGDPHLHIHIYLILAALNTDREWKSVWTSPLYENHSLLSARADAELAALIDSLGYPVIPAANSFRIKGFPDAVEHSWSSRANTLRTLAIDQQEAEFAKRNYFTEQLRARETRVDRSKSHSGDQLTNLKSELPREYIEEINILVSDAKDRAKHHSLRNIHGYRVEQTTVFLDGLVSAKPTISKTEAEITTLRALPGTATAATFREAANLSNARIFHHGRHIFYLGMAFNDHEDKFSTLAQSATGGDAPIRAQLTQERAMQFLAKDSKYPVIICEAKKAPEFTATLKRIVQTTADVKSLEKAHHGPIRSVIDGTEMGPAEIINTVEEHLDKSCLLAIVTEKPDRLKCSVASVLASGESPHGVWPSITVGAQPYTHAPVFPVDGIRTSLPTAQLLPELEQMLIPDSEGQFPLVVTQSIELAASINEYMHQKRLHGRPCSSKRRFVPADEMAPPGGPATHALLLQPQRGFRKGTIVDIDHADMSGIHTKSDAQSGFIPSRNIRHVCQLLSCQDLEIAADEPICLHSYKNCSADPFRVTAASTRVSANAVADQHKQFWSLGYAVPVCAFSSKISTNTVICVDEGLPWDTPEARNLGLFLAKTSQAPCIITLASGPCRSQLSQPQPTTTLPIASKAENFADSPEISPETFVADGYEL